jgi:subtilisin family serine protease
VTGVQTCALPISVGATTKTATGAPERISSYSNIGTQVDVLAPGGDFSYPSALSGRTSILSSYKGSNATYAHLAGTSMAAPQVAGAFAVIRSKNATCAAKTVKQIEDAMKSTGLAISDSLRGGTYTRKRINVAATIAALCP